MDATQLIDRCCRRDRDAWDELWSVLWPVAVARLRRHFPRFRADPSQAEDALQACFCQWLEHGLHVLRRFRAGTLRQLMAYLCICVERYAARQLRRTQAKQAHVAQAAFETARVRRAGWQRFRPPAGGLTEAEVQTRVRELREAMDEPDRDALDAVLNWRDGKPDEAEAGAEQVPSARTVRRKCKQLLDRYGEKA
jgi:hypothetical protein